MSTTDERLRVLKEKNPFISSSASDPWDNCYPHVESINKSSFDGLCSLIEQKRISNSGGYAGLLLGEVGSGKTHLISRIQKRSLDGSFSFAYIEPFEDADRVYRYLLREIVVNLVRSHRQNSGKTYLHKLIALIYLEMFQKKTIDNKYKKLINTLKIDPTIIFDINLPEDLFAIIEKHAYEFILGECPNISSEFLKVLFQFRIHEKKPVVLNWLKGDIIDGEDAQKIGVKDRILHEPGKGYLEQEARYILRFLDTLLARYNESLVVCFDRLENLTTKPQIDGFGKIVEFLVDTSKSMIPVVCFRGQQWEEKFKLKLNQHVTTRLENNRFELVGCDCEQALKIVKLRLESVLGKDCCDDFYPFDEGIIRELFSDGIESPREIITQVNHLLKDIVDLDTKNEVVEPPDKLLKEFSKLLKQIRSDFEGYHPDRGRLLRSIDLVLNSGFTNFEPVKRVEEDQLVKYTLDAGGKNGTIAFIVDLELHHRSVGSALKSAIGFLKSNKDATLFYVRDSRCKFPSPPKWKATNKSLDELKDIGGLTLFLDGDEASKWYALALLSYAVKEGDTVVDDPDNGIRSITQMEFDSFVRGYLENYDHSFFNDIKGFIESLP
jgi:hypothetical protein